MIILSRNRAGARVLRNVFLCNGELLGSGSDRKHWGFDPLVSSYETRSSSPAVCLVPRFVRSATAGRRFSLAGPRRARGGGAADDPRSCVPRIRRNLLD